jgi:hypothetical protein
MTPALIQHELGRWQWWLRPSHIVVRRGDEIEDAEAVGPTATVDPTPMIEGPWWGEKPWFTDGLSARQLEFLLDAGYPRKLLLQAADGLRRLLPNEICVKLAQDHETRMLIAPLYQSYVPFIRPLLALGCDLVEAASWDDEHQLKRLLIPAEHWGAATEVAVAAALKRAGLRFDREAPGRGDKRPEYLVHFDFWRYFVEVKTNPDSLADTRAAQLEQSIAWLHADLAESGVVTISGSGELHALLKNPALPLPENTASELRRDLRAFLGRPKGGYLAANRHDVGRYLVVEVAAEPAPQGTSISLAPETTDEEDARRVVRQIRRAAKQMPTAGKGFVVVEIGSFRNIVALQEVLETAFAVAPEAYEPVRGVVFHAGEPTQTGHRLRRVFGGPAPTRLLDAAEQKVLRALVLPRVEGGDTVRETLYGAGRSKLLEIAVER